MTDMTIERCRAYIAKCRESGKENQHSKAIAFLLNVIDEEHERHKALPAEELTIEYCERWLARWSETSVANLPFAVKALDYVLGVLAYERDQHKQFMEAIGSCTTNLTDAMTTLKERYTEHRQTTGFHYRMKASQREQTFLKQSQES